MNACVVSQAQNTSLAHMTLDHYSPATLKSAVKSFLIVSFSKFSWLSITKPFSLAKCSKQMKQKLVDKSAIACFGYTFWRLLTTSVKVSEPSTALAAGSSGAELLGGAVI